MSAYRREAPESRSEGNAHVDHEDLILGELCDLGLLLVVGPDSEQATEQKVVDLDLGVDRRERALGAEDLADQSITARQLRVDHCARAHRDRKASRTRESALCTPSIHSFEADAGDARVPTPIKPPGTANLSSFFSARSETILLRIGLQLILPSASFETTPGRTSISWPSCCAGRGRGQHTDSGDRRSRREKSGKNGGAHLENTLEERTTGDTALEFVHLGTGLVDIERPNHNQLGRGGKVAHGDRDLGHDVLDEGINVVPQLGRNRNDRSPVRDGSLDELEDLLVVFVGLLFADQVDLVLEDEDVLELHDLDRGEVLGRLRLRARLVRGDEEQRGVHHGGTVQHGGHQNVVTRAIDKRDVSVGV